MACRDVFCRFAHHLGHLCRPGADDEALNRGSNWEQVRRRVSWSTGRSNLELLSSKDRLPLVIQAVWRVVCELERPNFPRVGSPENLQPGLRILQCPPNVRERIVKAAPKYELRNGRNSRKSPMPMRIAKPSFPRNDLPPPKQRPRPSHWSPHRH